MQGFSDSLAALRDIHLPNAPSWWPLPPGWWLVMIIALIGGSWFICTVTKRWRKKTALRRSALASLSQLRRRAASGEPVQPLLAELSLLLRTVAIKAFPDQPVAGLIDQSWLNFLDSAGACDDFNHGPGRYLLSAPYRCSQAVDMQKLFDVIERWIMKSA